MALPFAESAVLLVVERADDGWCRGFARGKQGWFPASYVKTISNEQIAKVGIIFYKILSVNSHCCGACMVTTKMQNQE